MNQLTKFVVEEEERFLFGNVNTLKNKFGYRIKFLKK